MNSHAVIWGKPKDCLSSEGNQLIWEDRDSITCSQLYKMTAGNRQRPQLVHRTLRTCICTYALKQKLL